MLAALIAALLSLSPAQAAHVAAWAHGRPDLVEPLLGVCRRESRCRPLGVHDIDAHLSARAYWGQVRLGHLRRWCQGHGAPGRWSTRGAWGLQAASHWRYLPACYAPEVLDVPLVSAWVATRKYLARRDGRSRRGWCHISRRA